MTAERFPSLPDATLARAELAASGAGPAGHPDDDLVVVPARHPWRWLSAAIVAILVAQLVRAVATNPNFHWPVIAKYLFSEIILSGLMLTVWLTVVTMLVGGALGIGLATMRLSRNPLISGASACYLWFFRGTPLLVQLVIWYNMAALFPTYSFGVPFGPTLFHGSVNDLITPYTAAILGLGLNEGAYMAEIVRAGLSSVDRGQLDAARALGMTPLKTFHRVTLPQAMPFILPPTGNQTIGMLKTTSLVSVLALSDLLYSAQSIYSRNYQTIPLLLVACFWYLVATSVLSLVQSRIERRFNRGGPRPARHALSLLFPLRRRAA